MKFCRLLILLSSLPITLPAQTTNPASATTPLSITASPSAGQAPAPPPPLLPDPFTDPQIKMIVERQRKAVAGDTKETKALTADLQKWTAAQPENHLLQAYLGSLYTLDSRDAWPGPGKLTFLRDGGRLLDAAVAADPLNPAVRFVRAVDYFQLPSIFGKRQTARDDLQTLLKQAKGEIKCPYQLDTGTAQAIYYYAGLSLKQQWLDPEAREVWQRGWKLDPSSLLAAKIHGELANLK